MTRAGEYVLGTLAGAECEAFRAALATDPQLQAEVREWERRLAPLAGAISPETPSPAVWSAIESRLAAATAAQASDSTAVREATTAAVLRLRRSVVLWRGVAAVAGALAAALILFVAWGGRWPAPEHGQEFVAVVNRGGDLPALIVRVDTQEGVVTVRALGAEAPQGKNWSPVYWRGGEGAEIPWGGRECTGPS